MAWYGYFIRLISDVGLTLFFLIKVTGALKKKKNSKSTKVRFRNRKSIPSENRRKTNRGFLKTITIYFVEIT